VVPLAESDLLVKECLIRSTVLISPKTCAVVSVVVGLVASLVFVVVLAVVVSLVISVVGVVVWVVVWVVVSAVVSVVLKEISRVEDELVEWDRVLIFPGLIRSLDCTAVADGVRVEEELVPPKELDCF
jgi:hypothetical protein